jgi:MFS family permease
VQIFSGVVWGAYELAMFLLFVDAIPRERRTRLLTLYNLGNSLAMVGGGLAGAALLKLFGDSAASYLTLFALSSVARLGTLALLVRVPIAVEEPQGLQTSSITVRPNPRSWPVWLGGEWDRSRPGIAVKRSAA